MKEVNTERAAMALMDYKADIAQISRAFIQNNPEFPPQVMVVGLMEIVVSLYREMSGATRDRFFAGANAMWDTMDKHARKTLQ